MDQKFKSIIGVLPEENSCNEMYMNREGISGGSKLRPKRELIFL